MTSHATVPDPDHDAEVLIVGSGAGGATTAALLAEAGVDVLMVEEGPWIEPSGEVSGQASHT